LRNTLHEREQLCNQGIRKQENLLDIILSAREEEEFSSIAEQDIITMMLDLLLAGTDTTANTLSFLVAEMTNHPEMQARLHEELDRVIGRDRLPNVDDLANLPFLDAIVLETMRHYPAAPFGVTHLANEDMVVDKYVIPSKTILAPNIWAIHHNPLAYPDPHKFNPDRWLNDPSLKNSKHFVPFSVGPRICVARNLANVEARLVTAKIFQNLKVIPVDGKPIKIEEVAAVTLAPKNYKVRTEFRN